MPSVLRKRPMKAACVSRRLVWPIIQLVIGAGYGGRTWTHSRDQISRSGPCNLGAGLAEQSRGLGANELAAHVARNAAHESPTPRPLVGRQLRMFTAEPLNLGRGQRLARHH